MRIDAAITARRSHLAVLLVGTKRSCRDVRLESAFGGRAEVGFRGGQVR